MFQLSAHDGTSVGFAAPVDPLGRVGQPLRAVQAVAQAVVQQESQRILGARRTGHERQRHAPRLKQIRLAEIVVQVPRLVRARARRRHPAERSCRGQAARASRPLPPRSARNFPRIARQAAIRIVVGAALRCIDEQVQQRLHERRPVLGAEGIDQMVLLRIHQLTPARGPCPCSTGWPAARGDRR